MGGEPYFGEGPPFRGGGGEGLGPPFWGASLFWEGGVPVLVGGGVPILDGGPILGGVQSPFCGGGSPFGEGFLSWTEVPI